MTLNHRDGALKWWAAGMSVVPVVADGSKRPLGTWKNYQTVRATVEQVGQWFKVAPEQGVGVICGKVSSNLEMLEIEANRMGGEYLDKVLEAMEDQGVSVIWDGLLSDGYCETTPSGGIHILYRIADQDVPGNTKIALDVTGKITYAETRGEGGFVVVAPSGGTVHKTGESWTCVAGEIGTVPTITWDQRCKIHKALQVALDERVLPTYERPTGTQEYTGSGTRPGDAYNADPSVNVYDILTRNGWKYLGKMAGQDRYVHPLSSDMTTHSACTGYKGSENLYAWSGLPKEDFYDKFSLLAHLEFNGDFSAAGKYLAAQGYGDKPERLDISDWFEAEETSAVLEGPTPEKKVDTDGLPTLNAATYENFDWRESSLPGLFEDTYHHSLKYVASSRAWRIWDGTRWAEDARGAGTRAAVKLLATAFKYADAVKSKDEERGDILIKAAKGLSTMNKMRTLGSLAQSGAKIASSHSDFDRTEHLVTVENGILDLRSGTLLPHDRSKMLTKKMAVTFDPDADSTVLDKFLSDWMPDKNVRDYVARLLAVTLSGSADERVIPMLYGGSGSGKTAFLEMIYHVFGDFGAIAAEAALKPRADQDGPSEKLHQLKGSRMVKLSELSQGSVLNEALIKSITGSDTQTTRKLYGDIEEWKVQYMVWLATNHLPTISSNDEAIWKRVKPINFPGCFVDERGHVANPENRDLGRKLATGHASAVLNWILAGLKDYQENGLNEPAQIGEWLGQYRDDVDTVRQFLIEAPDAGQLKIGEDLRIGSRDLYKIYVAWSMENHIKPLSIKSFSQRMENSNFKRTRLSSGVYWKGLDRSGFLAESQTPANGSFWG